MIAHRALSARYIYSLHPESTWVVAQGQLVVCGEVLAKGVRFEHASAAGVITSISGNTLILETTPDEQSVQMQPLNGGNSAAILRRIQEAGIVGLGGGGFPTHLKLLAAARKRAQTLVVNAVECEPGITCDAALLQENQATVHNGIDAVRTLLELKSIHIAASDKTDFEYHAGSTTVIRQPKPTDGAERYLVERLTGETVPVDALPVDLGVVVLNVATLHAVGQALQGVPLTTRVVTVFGENQWVRIGTPLTAFSNAPLVCVGGELSGADISTTGATDKRTNSIQTARGFLNLPCIRCGACDDTCPEQLPVATLVSLAAGQAQSTVRDTASRCIGCGLCNPVCPSSINVAGLVRTLRDSQRAEALRTNNIVRAEQRYLRHTSRMAAEELAQAERRANRLARLNPESIPISSSHDG
ncbi:MAG: 4Fe-4S dicluster domain-containing protein [Gammaproteobacteria bacterium]|nr:4Fe-4S dicluster domain-containing protein [Gammaproteobacteria bacterium]